jgi:3-oxoacyl-[acyl-carrier protein] reductase
MNIDLTGQTALITGATRGIGHAISLALGKQGATVIGTATTAQGADRVTQSLAAAGINGIGLVLNVAEDESIQRLAETLKTQALAPTILVNNAGIARDNLLIRMKDDEWRSVIDTNLTGIYKLCKLVLRDMMKARYGRIINITSVVALSGNPGQANYAAAKAGIIGFTKSLAREVGSRNITVNAVAPGFIETDMTQRLTEVQRRSLLNQIALGRLGDAREVADAVVFLASAAAVYITGETINVNGGMYMA